MADSILARLRIALGYKSLSDFSKDWKALPEADKEQLKARLEGETA